SLATLDCLLSLAEVAGQPGYVKPTFMDDIGVEVEQGRHPMVEQLLLDTYVPNDIKLSSDETRALLITGPNMGGKSSYVRSVALIAIMAQIGSYVPAESARLGLLDAVFTRMGAFDNMMKGESTFMVELSETSDILKQATPRSLVILDELGRGTSTHDGVAIAQAVLDYVVRDLKSLTLFITHYQSLSTMAEKFAGELKNVHMRFTESGEESEDVTFLYQVGEGVAHRSYGLNVAKLANVPRTVLEVAAIKSKEMEEEVGRKRLESLARMLSGLSQKEATQGDVLEQLVAGIEQLNHYVVLGLPHPTRVASLTVQDIKLAYRRALLSHHPDKSVASQETPRPNAHNHVDGPKHTVDDITIAYRTLSDPSLRADYDRDLRLQSLSAVQPDTRERTFHSGLETVDLDELNFDEAKSVWTRGCRCGQEQGFVVIKEELEKEAEFGELVTGCRGCSLWLRVLFQAEAEDMKDTRANDVKADMRHAVSRVADTIRSKILSVKAFEQEPAIPMLGMVFAAWVIAPAIAGALGAIVFTDCKYAVLKRKNPVRAGLIIIPVFFAVTTGVLTKVIVWKGAPSLKLDNWGTGQILGCIRGVAGGSALLCTLFFVPFLHRKLVMDDRQLK
ncbi:hypothetical protein B0A49_01868, partial [Cryomyces minteri]